MCKQLVTEYNRRMRVRCNVCNCTLQIGSLKKHKETIKHLENINNIRVEEEIENDLENVFI